LVKVNEVPFEDDSKYLLPLTVNKDLDVGAFSLGLEYDTDNLVFAGFTNSPEGLVYKESGGTINIAWAEVSTLNLTEGDTLLNIEFHKIDDEIEEYKFNSTSWSEFADMFGNVYEYVELNIPGLKVDENYKDFGISNHPNPFKEFTQIDYLLPDDGFVRITVHNALGKVIETLIDENQVSGWQSIRFDGSKHGNGFYFYTIRFETKTRVYQSTQKMQIIK